MAVPADLEAVKILCKNQQPTRESISQDLGPFLADLKSSPRFGSSLLSKLARRKKLRHVSLVLDALLKNRCDVNEFHYGISISAFEKAENWERALRLLRQMDRVRVEPNTVTYGACISAMEKCSQWRQAVDLLAEMAHRNIQKNVITISAGISACAGHWWLALDLLRSMAEEKIDPDIVAFNACINACSTQWPVALELLQQMSGLQLQPDVISFSAAIAACEDGRQWEHTLGLFTEMRRKEIRLDDFSYNALISSFSRASEWQYALHALEEKAASGFETDIHACSAAISACERRGQWQHVLELWPILQEVQERANAKTAKLYEVSATGPSHITRHLKRALELQWAVGYPFLAAKEEQLTHGFYKYIAGMQALCARELLELVPYAQNVMDMFCGSGTVLVEALRAGKRAIGSDVSPLALLVATHHTDAAQVDLYTLLDVASELAGAMESRKSWHYLKSRISQVQKKPLRDALHFILLVALSRVQDVTYLHSSSKGLNEVPEDGLPSCMFLGVAQLYVARVRSLRARALESDCEIYRCDNRVLRLEQLVDAIVTGPPYPGVYDYHSPASSCADLLGGETLYEFCAPGYSIRGSKAPTNIDFPQDLSSSSYALGKEIGQNSLWQQDPAFTEKWQSEQVEWLTSAFENLREGGTATLMIGDGDFRLAGDGGFDNLQPTIKAAEQAGFETVATATIRGKSKNPKQPKGMKRTEHMVHLRKPRKRREEAT